MQRGESDRLTNVQRLGNILAASHYFADAREAAQAAVKVMAGEELGVPPVASMMGINIIKGKVAMGAHLIASRVVAHGYTYHIDRHDETGCAIKFYGKTGAELGKSEFTEKEAKAAGVFGEMYKKYPKNMYFARAMSNGAKWFTPEVFSGIPVYVPEELGAEVDGEGNAIIEAHPVAEERDVPAHPQTASDEPPPEQKPEHETKLISTKQRSRLYAIAKSEGGMNSKQYKAFILSLGYETDVDIPWTEYNDIVEKAKVGNHGIAAEDAAPPEEENVPF